MTKDELVAILRLQKIPHIGDITAKKLISHCGSPMAVFSDKVNHLKKIANSNCPFAALYLGLSRFLNFL